MEPKLQELRSLLTVGRDLHAAAALLDWDQSTYMPPGAADARARQLSTLSRLAHEKLTSPEIGSLLDELQPWAESLPFDSDEAGLVRVARRDYERRLKLPSAFVARFSEHRARSFAAWSRARPADDFAAVRPYLEKTVDLSREGASFYAPYEHVADPLIDEYDLGMRASVLRELFGGLRAELVPLVQAITAQPPASDECLKRGYPRDGQAAFFEQVVRAFGFDYNRGRVDVSPHPFTTGFSITDIRFTVRYKEDDLGEALFSAFHEAGHAMYEQGIKLEFEATPLARGTSSGVHESQSRLWENLVGRSKPFWSHYYPKLQATFPRQLGDVSLDTFYRAVNKVQRSLIRTDADEVTYNLHVMVRFDLELALLEGNLEVRDLPEAWRERYRLDLGIVPPDDKDGVLQDIHWYFGQVGGMFQGYTLGNILGAQFFQAALRDHPDIPDEIAQGRFDTLHGWLREQIYQHGSKYTASELVQRVTGGPLRIEPYIGYLRSKFGELYSL